MIPTFGFLWPFAPLFPAAVAASASVLPFKNHWQRADHYEEAYGDLGVWTGAGVAIPPSSDYLSHPEDSVTSYTRSIPNDTQHGSMATQLMPWG